MARERVFVLVLSSVLCAALFVPACGGGGGGGGDNGGTATWTHPAILADNISPDGQDVWYPKVAMDGNGNAIIVWQQVDGTSPQIYMSEYRNGAWTHPVGLGASISPYGTNAAYPDVAMDDNGNAIIAWCQDDGSHYRIFKSERRNGTWTHPANLADGISPAESHSEEQYPQVAMDNNGNAIIVWYQYISTATQVFMSEYRNGEWTHPASGTDAISLDGQWAYNPAVAMADTGDAVVVWAQYDGSAANQIYKSEYRNGSWTHPSGLTDNISPDSQSAYYPQVAMDHEGNALIAWLQYDGSRNQVFKSEYGGGVWTHPSGLADNISLYGKEALAPQVAMADNGEAAIVWIQYDGATWQVFKSERRNGAWTKPDYPADAISPDGKNVVNADVAMDDEGNTLIVWNQGDYPSEQIFKSEYRDGAWAHPTDLTDNISPVDNGSYLPDAAMSNDGSAIIVWYQSDGANYQTFKSEYR